MRIKKEQKPTMSVRIDAELLEEAKIRFDLPELIKALLEDALNKKRCPCCGQKVK